MQTWRCLAEPFHNSPQLFAIVTNVPITPNGCRVHPLTSIAWYIVCVATVYHPNLFFPVIQLTVVKHIIKQYMIKRTAEAQVCALVIKND